MSLKKKQPTAAAKKLKIPPAFVPDEWVCDHSKKRHELIDLSINSLNNSSSFVSCSLNRKPEQQKTYKKLIGKPRPFLTGIINNNRVSSSYSAASFPNSPTKLNRKLNINKTLSTNRSTNLNKILEEPKFNPVNKQHIQSSLLNSKSSKRSFQSQSIKSSSQSSIKNKNKPKKSQLNMNKLKKRSNLCLNNKLKEAKTKILINYNKLKNNKSLDSISCAVKKSNPDDKKTMLISLNNETLNEADDYFTTLDSVLDHR
jgi:hypothetical protein